MSLIMKQKGVQESRLVAIWASRSIRHFLVRDKAFAWTSTPHFSILPTTVQETNCNWYIMRSIPLLSTDNIQLAGPLTQTITISKLSSVSLLPSAFPFSPLQVPNFLRPEKASIGKGRRHSSRMRWPYPIGLLTYFGFWPLWNTFLYALSKNTKYCFPLPTNKRKVEGPPPTSFGKYFVLPWIP